jgi:uncharacterized protein (TIRG00374 family)
MLGRSILLAVTAISLYLLTPAMVELFSSWPRLRELSWPAIGAMVLLKTLSFICLWQLTRIVLGVPRMRPVALSHLAGNAFSRVVPGGAATAGAIQVRMLRDAGVSAQRGITGLTAANLLTFGTLLMLPVLAVPVLLTGVPVNDSLLSGLLIGGVALLVLFAVGAVLLIDDRPLRAIGRGVQRARNRLRPRHEPITGLDDELVEERNLIRSMVGTRWKAALLTSMGWWLFDYGVLLLALEAVGSDGRFSLVLIAYVSASLLGMVPLTPGGLGFVEVGLTGSLALAGVSPADALVATLAYRLINFWLPLPIGGAAYWLYRREHPNGSRASGPS